MKYLVLYLLYSVKGPELINLYVGQSEENVREGMHSSMPRVPLFKDMRSSPPRSVYPSSQCSALCHLL